MWARRSTPLHIAAAEARISGTFWAEEARPFTAALRDWRLADGARTCSTKRLARHLAASRLGPWHQRPCVQGQSIFCRPNGVMRRAQVPARLLRWRPCTALSREAGAADGRGPGTPRCPRAQVLKGGPNPPGLRGEDVVRPDSVERPEIIVREQFPSGSRSGYEL